uniref:Probable serine hydrolase n=1 Tax=Cacopsylla melanoneura TaxID=428564 RepID=A0A8D9F3H3_9HEMI
MGLLTFTEEVQIPMPWGHVRGKLWGSKLSKDKEPIIAMHGWLDNAGTFDHLLPYVTDKVSVLCLDLPGHGLSSHYPRGLRYDSLFDNVVLLRRIMNHFGWKRISLMGHSMGCNISFIFTALYPKDVNYIIALDSIAPLGFETDSEFVDYQADNLLKFIRYDAMPVNPGPHGSMKDLQDICIDAHKGSLTEASAKTLMIRGASRLRDNVYKFNRDLKLMAAFLHPPSFELIQVYAKNIKCHYLNIRFEFFTGNKLEKYDQILNIVKGASKNFKFVQETGTHHVHMNDPQKIALIINQFLFSCMTDDEDDYV